MGLYLRLFLIFLFMLQKPVFAQENQIDIAGVRWSPDGQYLTFISNFDGDYEIFVIKADGTGLKQLTENEVFDHTPSFTNDGNSILYVQVIPPGEEGNIPYSIPYMGIQKVEIEGGPPTPFFGFMGWINYAPKQIPDGRISFSTVRWTFFQKRDIYIWNPETGEIDLLVNSPEIDERSEWPPNGENFLFVSSRDWPGTNPDFPNRRYEIYIADSDGSNHRRLTFFDEEKASEGKEGQFIGSQGPRFFPDGQSFIYVSDKDGEERGDNSFYLYTLETNSEEKLPLFENVDFGVHDVSPDGTKIAVTLDQDGDGNWEIAITDLKTNQTRTVSPFRQGDEQ